MRGRLSRFGRDKPWPNLRHRSREGFCPAKAHDRLKGHCVMKNSILIRNILFAGLLLQSIVCCFESRGAAGDVDLSFNGGSGVNGPIQAVAVQPDGKAIIGGWFTTVQGHMRNGVARLNPDGTGDATFHSTAAGTWPASSVALQADGRVLVGGTRVVRLHADGSWDNSFTNILDEQIGEYGPIVYAIAVQPDGKVLIGGYFSYVHGVLHPNIARLNADGSLDGSFTPPASVIEAHTLVLQPDGKVLVAGVFDHQGIHRQTLVRLSSNGSLDNSFSPIEVPVYSLALQPDGKIVVAGSAYNGTHNDFVLARFTSAGILDTSFGASGWATIDYAATHDTATALAIQSDGGVLVGGYATNGTHDDFAVARLMPDGALDTAFGDSGKALVDFAGGDDRISTLAIQSNSTVVAAGYALTSTGEDFALVAFTL